MLVTEICTVVKNARLFLPENRDFFFLITKIFISAVFFKKIIYFQQSVERSFLLIRNSWIAKKWFLIRELLLVVVVLSRSIASHAQPGALDLSFDPGNGVNGVIFSTAIQADGKIIIAGDFTSYNGITAKGLARLYSDGSLDASFNPGTGVSQNIYSTAIQVNGKIIIGGAFSDYNGVPANGLMRVNSDGSADTSFQIGSGFDDEVRAIAIQSNGKILVGGKFTTYNGNAANYLVRLNDNGTRDNTFNVSGTGPNGTVEDILIQPFDEKIVICGDFIFYDNILKPAQRVARLNTNGTHDASFNTIAGAGSVVYACDLRSDSLLIGGNFPGYSATPRNRIALLNPNGNLNNAFSPGSGFNAEVRDVAVLDVNNDGLADNYLVVGNFTTYHGKIANRIALLNISGLPDSNFDSGTGADNWIYNLSKQADGRIIIAGELTSYNGISRKGIARIYICQTPPPGVITGSDSIFCPGEVFTYSVPYSFGTGRYEWMMPAGWTGSSDSSSITVTTNGEGGVISVRAFSDSCGYSEWQTKTIYRIMPPEVPICLVTVNDSSTHNILVWEEPLDQSLIDSFFIYRETTTGIYSRIASVHKNANSLYHDYSANPNATSYRYKLSVLDNCGVESEKSASHSTIHLQNLGNGNFQWTFYQIQNASNPVTSFNVYRDNHGDGNFNQIGFVPGTNSTFTDIGHTAFSNSVYVVDVTWNIDCDQIIPNVNTTRSNIRRKTDVDTVASIQMVRAENIFVYPNPAEDFIMVKARNGTIRQITLINSLGRAIRKFPIENHTPETSTAIPLDDLSKGVYVISIESDAGTTMRKLIIK